MEKYNLKDNKAHSRYEFAVDGQIAYIDYERDGDLIVLTHTIVPEEYEGRGIGSQLVGAALADIRRKGLQVIPQCPFVAVYIERHPIWRDLVYRQNVPVE